MDPSLDTPAMEPPPGVVPNFAEPGGSHALEHGMIVTGAIISAVAVLARLVSSAAARRLLIEDVLMVAASSVDLSSIFYTLSAMCLKVAILVNWLRIFVPAGQRNGTWWTLHVLIWAHVIFYSITALTGIFSCQPRQKIWDPWYVGGNCPINVKVQHIFISVFNFVSDTAILAMPQRIIWRLQMSRSQKWGLSLLFLIGIGSVQPSFNSESQANRVSCQSAWVSGVARTVYFVKMLENDDAMYNLTGVAIWTVWEMAAAFMVMGAPALPRAFKTLPMSESVASIFRSRFRRGQDSSSQPALPQYRLYRPKPRRLRGLWEISDLETADLVSMRSVHTISSTAEQASNVSSTAQLKLATVSEHQRQQVALGTQRVSDLSS
ncbi:hypothetical protein PG993_004002 [Apiospora rasikravindrae]|uniref:Rhodopsin domain-containing protein n=1 Tax=Apiospora rasikravindrae TaxID=990691 RepID=A0ABR1TBI9_9PEZI